MSLSVYAYRTKFIQDIIEPVSLQIIQLIEICGTFQSVENTPDLVPSITAVSKAIEQLSKVLTFYIKNI